MKTQSSINAAWLQLLRMNGEDSFLVTLDYKGDKDTVFTGIADAAKPHLPRKYHLDLTDAGSELGQLSMKQSQPFYTAAL